MIRISLNRILLYLLILSCVIRGVLFEGIFFAVLSILIYVNRKEIASNGYCKWFVAIIALYIFLLIINMVQFKTAVGWKPIGITKVLCGISLSVLISGKICKSNIDDIFIKVLFVFNLLFVLFGEEKHSGIGIFYWIDYPGQNTLGCLNAVLLPHIISTYKGKMKALRMAYIASFLLVFLKNIGSTLIFSVGIIFAWELLEFSRNHITLNRKRLLQRFHIIIPLMMAFMIFLFSTNNNVQGLYLDLLSKADRDRFTILSQAIERIYYSIPQVQLWGRGDNNYYMLSGRYVEAHNFIIEVMTFEGFVGLSVLIFETFVFARYMLIMIDHTSVKSSVILSVILGYLFFLLHPVYTTSFLVKLFFVLVNLRTCYAAKKNQKETSGRINKSHDKETAAIHSGKVYKHIYNIDIY